MIKVLKFFGKYEIMQKEIIQKAKERFIGMIDDYGKDPFGLESHIASMEKWAERVIGKYKEADGEVLRLAVYLHDIGHYPIDEDNDHAVKGEKIAREFLIENNYPADKMDQVLHAVRAHRCRDVEPETLEARLIAFIDSASHMTDSLYIGCARDSGKEFALAKIERDYRDLGLFPEMQVEMKGLCEAWKRLVEEYFKVN